jgi:hypothetical protein
MVGAREAVTNALILRLSTLVVEKSLTIQAE